MTWFQRILRRPFFIKLFNWEYWSFTAIYLFILPVYGWLAIRARSFFFFSAANPSIENGGFLMESKKKIYEMIPDSYYAKTALFTAGVDANSALERVKNMHFTFPLIGKPDIGGKGVGVKRLLNESELLMYIGTAPLDFLIQEYVALPYEVGVFYFRYPNSKSGNISGIVKKEMLTVTGDGRSSIRNLLSRNKRYILQLPALEKLYGVELEKVLPDQEQRELVPYGNHARGARFLDASHLADEKLTSTIDNICQQVPGFFFGRLDIRFNSWEELRDGKNISIIELNGAGSEPTHIYDPRHSLFFAWKEIIRHWVILWRISLINHKAGIPYLTSKQGLRMMKENRAFEKKMTQLYV